MTRIGRRLIEDFILPALNDQRYGILLRWVDKEKGYFSIRWHHKNAAKWTLTDTVVFQDWDKLKGHYHPEQKGYYMQAKQRFRAALYKLNSVRKIHCENKNEKKYQLLLDPEKRKFEYLNTPKMRCPKKTVENNRVSVITKHTSLVEEKPEPIYYAPPTSPPSPVSSDDSDCSDNMEFANCIHDYKIGQKNHNQMILSNNSSYGLHISPKKESPLREINDCSHNNNYAYMMQRASHMPIQPVPAYHTASTKRFEIESPRLLLVKTYHDDYPKEEYDMKEEYLADDECDSSTEYALNLSVKSDDSDVVSR